MDLRTAQCECERHLAEMELLFKPYCRLTLLMRNPKSDDGDMILTRDELPLVIEAIKKLEVE